MKLEELQMKLGDSYIPTIMNENTPHNKQLVFFYLYYR